MATRESQATNPIWNGICFLSQQSAEKYLKAYLEEAGTAFPKTHDLVVLLNLTGGVLTNLETMRADLAHLGVFGISARYPGVHANQAAANQSLTIASMVRDEIRQFFGLPPQ
ncbi:MAG: HEPN domain-containing protein [Fimbriimonadia bacterium]|nr:HEPN domain-containing protein [Fimbriimonadia bacterium]